jgi:hypothetical protein
VLEVTTDRRGWMTGVLPVDRCRSARRTGLSARRVQALQDGVQVQLKGAFRRAHYLFRVRDLVYRSGVQVNVQEHTRRCPFSMARAGRARRLRMARGASAGASRRTGARAGSSASSSLLSTAGGRARRAGPTYTSSPANRRGSAVNVEGQPDAERANPAYRSEVVYMRGVQGSVEELTRRRSIHCRPSQATRAWQQQQAADQGYVHALLHKQSYACIRDGSHASGAIHV